MTTESAPRLLVTDTLGQRIIAIDKPTLTLGRRSETDVRVQGAGVSRVHAEIVTVKAIGLITTKMPDGSPGFSLLIIISAEFTPIQLGFGFTLNGVGGLCGINRNFVTDAIQAGLIKSPDEALEIAVDTLRDRLKDPAGEQEDRDAASELLTRLQQKLDVGSGRVYALIDEKVRQTHLPRHLAAIALAFLPPDRGIS